MKQGYKNVIFLLLFLCSISTIRGQEKTVSGKVSDNSGVLPGVSVLIKGTLKGTETDFDGKYSIKAKKGDVLVFSFLGMKTVEKTVSDLTVINVTLQEDANVLDEVVVTGVAGATNRKKLSITVDKVGEDQIKQVTASSAAAALQGKVSGLTINTPQGTPGASVQIQLRGATNLSGSQAPLILVDGVILEGSLSDINVDDIASFEVLKGASASSYYGSRAGNGVIVITTKRGKSLKTGQSEITVRTEFAISEASSLLKTANSHYYQLDPNYKNYSGYTRYAGVTYPDGYTGVYDFNVVGNRLSDADHYVDNPYAVNYNPQKQFLRKGSTSTHFLSFSNRSEKTNIYTSFENYTNEGILKEVKGYERQSIRVNADHKVNDWLKISASNGYIHTLNRSPSGVSADGGGVFFSLALLEPDINLNAPNSDGQPYTQLPFQFDNRVRNPLYQIWKNKNTTRENRFLGSYVANIKFTNWLNAEAKYAIENTTSFSRAYSPYNSLTYTGGTDTSETKGSLTDSQFRRLAQTMQVSLNFAKSYEDLNIKAKLSHLYESNELDFNRITGSQFVYPDLPNFNNFLPANINARSLKTDRKAVNYFGILGLDYKDRYIADFLIRRDGSSLFGVNERFANYYRVSGAYRITEDFQIPNVQELKIHAAVGTAGQRPSTFNAQYANIPISNGVQSTSGITIGNPNLKPSKSTEFEVGVTAEFLNRFNFTFVYSNTDTDDQILRAPQPIIKTPYPYQWINAGSLNAKAYEAQLGVKLFDTEDFKWSVNANFSKYTNEITKLNVGSFQTGPDSQDADQIFYITEGETFGAMYGKTFVTTLDQMSKQLPSGESISNYTINSDGFVIKKGTEGGINEKAIVLQENGLPAFVKIGDATPDFKIGFTTNVSYKGFGLYALLDWNQGGDIYNRTRQWTTRDNRSDIVDQTGKPDNLKKTYDYYQSLYDKNDINSFWVEDGTYVKLREVALSYSFDKKILSKISNGFFSDIKFSLVGRNLITWTNYSGYDPEVATYGDNNGQTQFYAVDFGVYPQVSSYALSVQLKF